MSLACGHFMGQRAELPHGLKRRSLVLRRSPSQFIVAARRGQDSLMNSDAADIVNLTRQRMGSQNIRPGGKTGSPSEIDQDADFLTKLKAAWRIFFPEKPKSLSPKEEGKKRLRMILVADRCGMSSDSLVGMRESIVKAMQEYVEVESDEAVEVNLSMDPEIGTIYSVAVPVRRVKPRLRPPMAETLPPGAWDPSDPDSDPGDQFPYGT